jgi:hypothetical protein
MTEDNTFDKLGIVLREGLQAFRHYAFCGLSVDGTFIKNDFICTSMLTFLIVPFSAFTSLIHRVTTCLSRVGGVLLIACFRNGNKELQIVACGIVSIENEENWFWFLDLILKYLATLPAFIISDRDKGLCDKGDAAERSPQQRSSTLTLHECSQGRCSLIGLQRGIPGTKTK